MVDWLVGWLVSELVACSLVSSWVVAAWWLVGGCWFIGWLVDWLVDWLVGWMVGWLIGWLVVRVA